MTESSSAVARRTIPPVPMGRWMWPAWKLGLLRPGLRSAIVGDARRLETLPRWVAIALPLVALLVPALLELGHLARGGPWTYDLVPDPWTLQIYDVFTESVPFVLAAAAIGLASPAAGVLFVLVSAVGNLFVTLITGEFVPPLGALLGRLVSYVILWLLVVEIPLLGRVVVEWAVQSADASRRRRLAASIAGAATVGALAYVWTHGARLLIAAVYFQTSTGLAPAPAFLALLWWGPLVAFASGAWALVVFGIRYLGPDAFVARPEDEPDPILSDRPMVGYVVRIVLALAVLTALVEKPVDATILILGLLAAGPIARRVLRATGLAEILVRVPWPLRLLAGFGATIAFAVVFLGMVGISDLSRFFNEVVAVAIGLVIMEIFLAADEVASSPGPSRARSVAEGLILGSLLTLAIPAIVLADDNSAEPAANAAAAAAVGGAAAAAAMARRQGRSKMMDVKRSAPAPRRKKGPPKKAPPKGEGAAPPPQTPAPERGPSNPEPGRPIGPRGPLERPGSQPLPDFDAQQAEKSSFTRGPSDSAKNVGGGAEDALDK